MIKIFVLCLNLEPASLLFLSRYTTPIRPLIITQHGKGAAVLLDVGEFEAMQKKIELLQDIQTSISQLDSGAGVTHDDAKEMVLKNINK